MINENNEKIIDSSELAKILGITARTVQILAGQGVITCQKTGKKNRYNLYTAVHEYIEYYAKKAGKKISSFEERKLDEEIRLKRAKADMAEMELEEIRGSLHAAEDVENATTDLVMCIRSALLTLPGMLAVDVAETTSAAEASEIIKKAVCDILEELANYKYNPEEYKRRARERQGWKNRDREDEDG